MEIQRLQALLSLDTKLTTPSVPETTAPGAPDFSTVLRQAIRQVESDQVAASDAARKLATGQVTDVAEVMIASERANLSLGLALQVRTKVLEAYQEIMRMPL